MPGRIKVWVQHFKDRKNLVLQWTDPTTGQRKSKSAETDDPALAEHRRVDLEADLNAGRYLEPSGITWEQFREEFEERHVNTTRPNSQRNYRTTLDQFEEIVRPRKLADINTRSISTFAAGLRKKPGRGSNTTMAPSTIENRLLLLHKALAWAQRQEYLPKLPDFPEVKVPRKKPMPVPEAWVERLLAGTDDPQLRAFILCAWLAGMRLGEAYHLEREPSDDFPWVDWDGNRVWFPAEFVKAVEDQWVPLDPELKQVLAELPADQKRLFRFLTPEGEAAVPVTVGGKVLRLAKKLGLKMTYRTLRRGFGCSYAAKVPAQVLQRLMRHASITTTLNFYANLDEATMQAVLGKQNPTGNEERK